MKSPKWPGYCTDSIKAKVSSLSSCDRLVFSSCLDSARQRSHASDEVKLSPYFNDNQVAFFMIMETLESQDVSMQNLEMEHLLNVVEVVVRTMKAMCETSLEDVMFPSRRPMN